MPVVQYLKVKHLGSLLLKQMEMVSLWKEGKAKKKSPVANFPFTDIHSVGGFKSSFVGVFKPQQLGNYINKIYRERQSG